MVGCDPRGAEHPLHVGWPLGVDDLEFIDHALGHEWAYECTPKRVEGGGWRSDLWQWPDGGGSIRQSSTHG